jgi:hypothetical protein
MRASRIVVVLYVIAGVIVASQNDYLENLDNARRILSALLAIVLWPLVLGGFEPRID